MVLRPRVFRIVTMSVQPRCRHSASITFDTTPVQDKHTDNIIFDNPCYTIGSRMPALATSHQDCTWQQHAKQIANGCMLERKRSCARKPKTWSTRTFPPHMLRLLSEKPPRAERAEQFCKHSSKEALPKPTQPHRTAKTLKPSGTTSP